jgi:hypothetical protein
VTQQFKPQPKHDAAPKPVKVSRAGKIAKPTEKKPFNREEYQRDYLREYMRRKRAEGKYTWPKKPKEPQ